jgi:hypothetical protein
MIRWTLAEEYLSKLDMDSLPSEHALRFLSDKDVPSLLKRLSVCRRSDLEGIAEDDSEEAGRPDLLCRVNAWRSAAIAAQSRTLCHDSAQDVASCAPSCWRAAVHFLLLN